MHNLFSALAFSLFKPPMYNFCPALVFMGQSRYTIRISTVPISSGRKYSMDIKFSGSDAGGFQFDPNASASPASRSAARAAASRSTRSSRCLSAQSSSMCSCPPSTCMPKSSTVSCCCFASRTASARSSPPAFRARGPRATSRSSKSSARCPSLSWRRSLSQRSSAR